LLVQFGSLSGVPSLLAVEVSGPRFVDVLTSAWAAGDAVAPVDPRLPRRARLALLDALRPAWVVEPDGSGHRRGGDRPVQRGDALVVATSGTTGAPKGVVLTHDAVRASARATSDRLGVDPARDRWLACLPLAHVGGLSVVTRALATGTPLTVHDRFEAAAVERAPIDEGATLVSLVATALRRIDPTPWRVVVLGGDAPPRQRPPNTVVTYGLTESGSGVVYDGVPLDGVEVRIGPDEQILLRGPMLARAYRTPTGDVGLVDADGWLPTADVGYLDPAGLLVVAGRHSDVIVTGGEKVWPAAVERAVRRHPGVADVAVVGVTDADWGQRVVAVVVMRADQAAVTIEELRAVVAAVLPAHAAPRQVVVTTALPRTSLGKVRRAALALQLEHHSHVEHHSG
jgi:O-succinylbenzoic acid--CoA ligase